MRPRIVFALVALLVVVSVGGLQASAGGGNKFSASLTGYEEAPLTLSVAGTGSFSAQISKDETSISYTLSYSGLTGPALFAHIHLGMPAIAGGVIAFLCDSDPETTPPAGTPACPGTEGTVEGTIEAADVIGPTGQRITAGEFSELVAAMRFGATYVNVHTTQNVPGEIRGQIG